MSGQGSKFGDFLTGILLGALAGYVVALLNAPRPGPETRQILTEKSRELRDRAVDTLQTTVDKTGKIVSDSRGMVGSTLETTMNRMQEQVSDLKGRGENVVTDVRSQVSDNLHRVADKMDPNQSSPAQDMGMDTTSPQI